MPRPETAVHLLTSLACVAANNEPEAMWKKSVAIPLAICRTLIAFHNFLQAYIHNGVLSAIVQFYVKSSILAHENCLWRDSS